MADAKEWKLYAIYVCPKCGPFTQPINHPGGRAQSSRVMPPEITDPEGPCAEVSVEEEFMKSYLGKRVIHDCAAFQTKRAAAALREIRSGIHVDPPPTEQRWSLFEGITSEAD